MDYTPFMPHGLNFLWGIGIVVYIAFIMLAIGVVLGLLIVLVRFLLVGTRAAQLYLTLNGPTPAEKAAAADAAASAPRPTPAPTPAPAPAAPPVGAEQVAPEPVAAEPATTATPDVAPAPAEPEVPVHTEDPTPPDVRSDDIVFSEDVIPPAATDDAPPAPPARKPATRAPRKPKTPPTV
jgi:hypothetical protein